MEQISSETYVRLTTFTSDGSPKHTPVWIAPFGPNGCGLTTDEDSWKVRRIRNSRNVELVPSDSRGRVDTGAEPVTGRAMLIASGQPDYEMLEAALLEKYGYAIQIVSVHSEVAP